MGKKKICELIKIYFVDELSEHPSGISPGGGIFPIGYYEEFSFEERSVTLKPFFKIKEEKESITFLASDGSAVFLNKNKIMHIEKVKKEILWEPLHRDDLIIFDMRAPQSQNANVDSFFIRNSDIIVRHQLTGSTNIEVISGDGNSNDEVEADNYKVLVTEENKEQFIKKLFEANIIPLGRVWMFFYHHPTPDEVRQFDRQL